MHSYSCVTQADFDPVRDRAETPRQILMKLNIVDYIRDPTPHDNFGGGSATWVVWAYTFCIYKPEVVMSDNCAMDY